MMWRVLALLCLSCVPAFAYLDPGSGSLLLSSIVAVFASVVFFFKNLFYKLTSPSTFLSGGFSSGFSPRGGGNSTLRDHIVFYSEGKQYYFTFKPILDALDSLKHPYTYLTSGEDDPALAREGSQSFGTFTYIGEGNKAYIKLNTLRADICVLTTPGLNVLQIKRSRGVRHYCHIVHSLTPMTYRAFGLDYFDSVLVANEIQKDFVREVEAAHDVKRKYIGVVGSTYLDELSKLRNSSLTQSLNDFGGSARSLTPSKLPSPRLEKHSNLTQDTRISEGKPSAESKENRESSFGNVDSESNAFTESNSTQSHTDSQKSELAHTEAQEILASCDDFVGYQARGAGSYLSGSDQAPSVDSRKSAQEANLSKTILVSPSWGKETILTKYGLRLLEPLAQSTHHIIIRPHPQSLIGEAESKNIAYLQKSLQQYQNVEWDIGTPNVYAFARADMMISDFSSVIFDFVCLEGKPVLTLDFSFDPAGYDLADINLEHFYTFEALKAIGGRLEECDFPRIEEIIAQTLDSAKTKELKACAEELWCYASEAGERAAREILHIERELLEREIGAVLPQVRRIRELDSMISGVKI